MNGLGPDDTWKFHVSNDFVFRGGWQLGTSVFIEEFYFPPDLYTDYAIQRQTPTGTEIVPFVGTPGIMNYDLSLRLTTPSAPRFTGSTSVILGRDENFDEWAAAYIMFLTLEGTWRPSDQIREWRVVSYASSGVERTIGASCASSTSPASSWSTSSRDRSSSDSSASTTP